MTARLFVAVWPPAEVVEALRALPRPELPGLRWTAPEQWHVTLRFLGACDDAAAAAVVSAFWSAPLPGRPCVAAVGPEVGRFGRRVLHVPVSGLAPLVAAFAGLPSPDAGRPFAGHLTLARARDRRGVDLRPLTGAAVSASFVVEEVTLVRSHLGRGPARYEVLARRSLG